ncbi:MAG: hypothetical protein WCW61_03325 [Patescibacteria group bacterium]
MEKTLNCKINGVIEMLPLYTYVKTPEALKVLFEKLERLGYQISPSERIVAKRSSKMQQAQLWFASLSAPKGKKKKGFFEEPEALPESLTIRETWSWAPLRKSRETGEAIITAIGMTSDCGYYYQDGRKEFHEFHLERMRIFVTNFTDIPITQWNAMIKNAPLSGPGMVKAIIAFCQNVSVSEVEVEDAPNVAHLLLGFSKLGKGQPRTEAEITAMNRAAANHDIRKDFLENIGG